MILSIPNHTFRSSFSQYFNKLILLLMVLFTFNSCTPTKELTQEKWFENPNGQSELASTMREMYDAMKAMEYNLINGKKVKQFPDFNHMLTDTPTDAALDKNIFDPFAKAWLSQMESMKSGNKKQQRNSYTAMVNTCIACHDQLCPGPITRINKLLLPD